MSDTVSVHFCIRDVVVTKCPVGQISVELKGFVA
jgi:hypothetical protein